MVQLVPVKRQRAAAGEVVPTHLEPSPDIARGDFRWIGHRIRRLRSAAGLSLRDVSSRSGISVSMLSQLETGRVVPSLMTLYTVTESFGVHFSDLLSDQRIAQSDALVRKADRPTLRIPGSDATYELITGLARRQLQLVEVILTPTLGPVDHRLSHSGDECVVVLEGEVTVRLDETLYELCQGDSLYFDAMVPHRFGATGAAEARLITVMTPPPF